MRLLAHQQQVAGSNRSGITQFVVNIGGALFATTFDFKERNSR
jgi:hypothetical protein